jgi:hypothetical protein
LRQQGSLCLLEDAGFPVFADNVLWLTNHKAGSPWRGTGKAA